AAASRWRLEYKVVDVVWVRLWVTGLERANSTAVHRLKTCLRTTFHLISQRIKHAPHLLKNSRVVTQFEFKQQGGTTGPQKVLGSAQYCRLMALNVNLNELDVREVKAVECLHHDIQFNDLANARIVRKQICGLDCSDSSVVRIEPHLGHASPV